LGRAGAASDGQLPRLIEDQSTGAARSPMNSSSAETQGDAVEHGTSVPEKVSSAVLVRSDPLPRDAISVRGYEFGDGAVDYDALLRSYASSGFQATNFGRAVDIVNDMLSWRPNADDIADGALEAERCRIFLGYTSNLVSSGLRETIRFLAQHKLIDVIVSTAGGVEEDLIKCLGSTIVGDFRLDGKALRKQGMNRIGNLLVPNDNYCRFEDWVIPALDEALEAQKQNGIIHTPSSLIALLGRRINSPDSICYWAAKNEIPIYCPAITDGSLGDMIFFHSYKNPGLIIDLVGDIRGINRRAIESKCTGVVILGGGVVKHHIANANLMRNGTDFAVYVNTGQEFDGSDSGASVDEAVSWGKIKGSAKQVKVCADATLVFPLLVAQTFAAEHLRRVQS
jgi:deoxyhypusine synthase